MIRPQLLLADEPTGNLDSYNSERLLELLCMMRAEYRLTILVATHSREIAEAADRVVEIRDGRLVGET